MSKDFKKLITFYIGQFDKDTYKQEKPIEFFLQLFDILFDGYTLSDTIGRYKHDDGTVVTEPSFKLEYVDYNNTLDVQKTCAILKKELNQECIMVTCTEIDVAFI